MPARDGVLWRPPAERGVGRQRRRRSRPFPMCQRTAKGRGTVLVRTDGVAHTWLLTLDGGSTAALACPRLSRPLLGTDRPAQAVRHPPVIESTACQPRQPLLVSPACPGLAVRALPKKDGRPGRRGALCLVLFSGCLSVVDGRLSPLPIVLGDLGPVRALHPFLARVTDPSECIDNKHDGAACECTYLDLPTSVPIPSGWRCSLPMLHPC